MADTPKILTPDDEDHIRAIVHRSQLSAHERIQLDALLASHEYLRATMPILRRDLAAARNLAETHAGMVRTLQAERDGLKRLLLHAWEKLDDCVASHSKCISGDEAESLCKLSNEIDAVFAAMPTAEAAATRTRCSVGFAHPPHDFCDGDPGAKFGATPPHPQTDEVTRLQAEQDGLRRSLQGRASSSHLKCNTCDGKGHCITPFGDGPCIDCLGTGIERTPTPHRLPGR
jgi:hypothetical protein